MLIPLWNKNLIRFCNFEKLIEIIWKRNDFSQWYDTAKPIPMIIIAVYQNDVQFDDKRIPIMNIKCVKG